MVLSMFRNIFFSLLFVFLTYESESAKAHVLNNKSRVDHPHVKNEVQMSHVIVPAASHKSSLINLDETGRWEVSGKGSYSAVSEPQPIEGVHAIECLIDETQKGITVVQLTLPPMNVQELRKLRFRMFGNLEKSALQEVRVSDTAQHTVAWILPVLERQSSNSLWAEFEIFLDSPSRGGNIDFENLQQIVWRIAGNGDGEGKRTLVFDGVSFEYCPMSPGPGLDQAVLNDNGYEAVFSKSARFELVQINTPDGSVLPVRTAHEIHVLDPPSVPNKPIIIGGPLRWEAVTLHADTLRVKYRVGGIRYQNTYTWEAGALAVRRRLTALRDGKSLRRLLMHRVQLGDQFSRFAYRRGRPIIHGAFPATDNIRIQENWLAVFGNRIPALALIFPEHLRDDALNIVSGREFFVRDRFHFSRSTLTPGESYSHKVWIAPLGNTPSPEQAEACARKVADHLLKTNDAAYQFFFPDYLGIQLPGNIVASDNSLSVWETSNTATVPEDTPPPKKTAEGIYLTAARNEIEPIHLVVSAEKAMQRISFTCTALQSGDHHIPAEQFRVRYAGYVRIRPAEKDERIGFEYTNASLYRYVADIDHGATYLQTDKMYGGTTRVLGAYEDVLYDMPAVDVHPGKNQPVWITLAIPPDAHPGTYHGNVLMHEGTRQVFSIPITVTVWRFTLPHVSYLSTWYQLWMQPQNRHQWRTYYRNLVEHKVSGFGWMPVNSRTDTEPKLTWDGQKLHVDWTAYDSAASFLFDELGFRFAKFPHGRLGYGHSNVVDFAGLKEGTAEYQQALWSYLIQARKHLRERGWLKNMAVYIFDEPDNERIGVIQRNGSMVMQALPELLVFAASGYKEGLIGAVNAWCPDERAFGRPTKGWNRERIMEARRRGEHFLWYNHFPQNPGPPFVSHRAHHWSTWKEQMKGYFLWSINSWGSSSNPWSTKYPAVHACWIYPGKDGPVDSIRWESIREGLEDYDYLVMLENEISRLKGSPQMAKWGNRILKRARDLIKDPWAHYHIDPSELLDIRNEIGEFLNETSRQ